VEEAGDLPTLSVRGHLADLPAVGIDVLCKEVAVLVELGKGVSSRIAKVIDRLAVDRLADPLSITVIRRVHQRQICC
jgi:hypothetical protein